jgi:hypothetical protein
MNKKSKKRRAGARSVLRNARFNQEALEGAIRPFVVDELAREWVAKNQDAVVVYQGKDHGFLFAYPPSVQKEIGRREVAH